MSFLPHEFSGFLAPNVNRTEYLRQWLTDFGIPYSVIPLEGRTHFLVKFPLSAYNPMFRTKTLLVHYDRFEPSPGANDNSAAVYQVMCFVRRLLERETPHNVRIFFTDGEESETQGAFAVAQLFRKLGITSDDVIAIDSCGRGNVLVVSTAGKDSPASLDFQKNFLDVYHRVCTLASRSSPSSWVSIPVPYSDNAGFLAQGIPAVAVTVLPENEVSVYMRQLQIDKNFERAVMTRSLSEGAEDAAEILLRNEKLPQTWRMMHTPLDNEASLTPESFVMMERFLDAIADSKALV